MTGFSLGRVGRRVKPLTWMSMQYSPSRILYICSSNFRMRSVLPGRLLVLPWSLCTPLWFSRASASSRTSAAQPHPRKSAHTNCADLHTWEQRSSSTCEPGGIRVDYDARACRSPMHTSQMDLKMMVQCGKASCSSNFGYIGMCIYDNDATACSPCHTYQPTTPQDYSANHASTSIEDKLSAVQC